MSVDKDSQDARSSEESGSDYEDDDYDDYYNNNDDDAISDEGDDVNDDGNEKGDRPDNNNVKKMLQDLEYFDYKCLTPEEVDDKLDNECASLANRLKVTSSVASLVLQAHKWKSSSIIQSITDHDERNRVLIESNVHCSTPPRALSLPSPKSLSHLKEECGVCLDILPRQRLSWLPCTHSFCKDCWLSHIENTVNEGMSDGVKCMANGCNLNCPKDFIEQFLTANLDLLHKFRKRHRSLCISAHFQLRFCIGADCQMVMTAEVPKARLVECKKCQSAFCFECGNNYHSPIDCETITKWLTKCRDDSETANYICANTKSCPQCHICIEKNGGCNHITCWKCKHDFCWMCLQDWKSHGNSYYSCSKYLENPLIADQSHEDWAREALKKYLFYFERWENHHRSLLLEEETRKRIQKQIEEKVMRNEGTWIDWQYLLRAGELLAKCRLTLQNTYPQAYYTPQGAEKELFEYQQAQLELEIEELSWKLERAGSYQRGDIENQMDVAAKRRHTLLAHFLKD